jgi:hypothetical protein
MQTFEVANPEKTDSIKNLLNEENVIAHLSDDNEVAADYSQRTQKAKNMSDALSASRRRRGRKLCVSVALQSIKEPFGAIETTYKIFIACSFYSLLQYFIF